MTFITGILILYVVIIAASCRVFRGIHQRDEQMGQLLQREMVATMPARLQKTGS